MCQIQELKRKILVSFHLRREQWHHHSNVTGLNLEKSTQVFTFLAPADKRERFVLRMDRVKKTLSWSNWLITNGDGRHQNQILQPPTRDRRSILSFFLGLAANQSMKTLPYWFDFFKPNLRRSYARNYSYGKGNVISVQTRSSTYGIW
jgi:hypothetical protein